SQNSDQLAAQFNALFDDAKKKKDRDEKRQAIARLLVAFVDALPNEEEKKQRQAKDRPDPTADLTYQRMLGVVGTKAAAVALDEQAQALYEMAGNVRVARDEARLRFADLHDDKLRELEHLEERLQAERDLLAEKQKAAAKADVLAKSQKD